MLKFFIPIFFLGGAAGLFFTFIDPQYKSLAPIQAEVASLDEALTKSEELQEIRDELGARRQEITLADEERLTRLLPDTIDTVRLILDIDAVARLHNLSIHNIIVESEPSYGDPAESPSSRKKTEEVVPINAELPYQTARMHFGVSASYEEFVSFIHDLERKLRLADIISLSLTTTRPDIYDFEVSLETYWMP
jgi:hypothetical protein